MRVVVDANIVAASLVRPNGWSARELRREDVEWFVPVYLFEEIAEHESDLAERAGCAPAEFRGRVKRLHRLQVVAEADLLAADRHPLVHQARAVDPDDAVYLAAFVAVRADRLWTRDQRILERFPGIATLVLPGPMEEPASHK